MDSPRERDLRNSLPPYGCLKGEAQLSAIRGFECNPILTELAEGIRRALNSRRLQIGELTLCMEPVLDDSRVATAKIKGPEGKLLLGEELDEPTERAKLALSVHCEGKPDHLHAAVTHALTEMCSVFPNLFVRIITLDSFRPQL